MTNFERIKNLTFEEILPELGIPAEKLDIDRLSEIFSDLMVCESKSKPCKLCNSVAGSCRSVCSAWLGNRAEEDANFGADRRWRDFDVEKPPELDCPNEYNVVANNCELATVLTWDGEEWYDMYHETYHVKWWMPIPEAPIQKKER